MLLTEEGSRISKYITENTGTREIFQRASFKVHVTRSSVHSSTKVSSLPLLRSVLIFIYPSFRKTLHHELCPAGDIGMRILASVHLLQGMSKWAIIFLCWCLDFLGNLPVWISFWYLLQGLMQEYRCKFLNCKSKYLKVIIQFNKRLIKYFKI